MKLLESLRTRKPCNHAWTSSVHSGLRRDLCTVCGTISMSAVAHDFTVPEKLRIQAPPAR